MRAGIDNLDSRHRSPGSAGLYVLDSVLGGVLSLQCHHCKLIGIQGLVQQPQHLQQEVTVAMGFSVGTCSRTRLSNGWSVRRAWAQWGHGCMCTDIQHEGTVAMLDMGSHAGK